jgi:hypothetical protein
MLLCIRENAPDADDRGPGQDDNPSCELRQQGEGMMRGLRVVIEAGVKRGLRETMRVPDTNLLLNQPSP